MGWIQLPKGQIQLPKPVQLDSTSERYHLMVGKKLKKRQDTRFYNSYTMAMRDFADIYTQSQRVFISPKSQAAIVSTNIYHSHVACFYI